MTTTDQKLNEHIRKLNAPLMAALERPLENKTLAGLLSEASASLGTELRPGPKTGDAE